VFEKTEFARRIALAREAMAGEDAELLLVDHAECLAWLTGYTVSETMYRAAFLPREGEPWFVLRELDTVPCRAATWIDDIVGFADTAEPQEVMAGELAARGFAGARIGADFQSYAFTAHTLARFGALLPEARFVDLPRVSDRLRAVKSPPEIAFIERAAGIADEAMTAIHGAAREGFTPRGASALAAGIFVRRGADTGDVGPIVRAHGDNGFLHAALGDDRLGDGDILHVELIPKVANYSARLMRPILVGADREGLGAVADRLIALQDRQIAAMRSGIEAREADAVLREAVLDEGLRESYGNVSAYMLGLYGRTPRTSDFSYTLKPDARWRLETGMVFHVYTSARGLGFSETVAVTPEGGRRLTRTPRRLLRAGL